MNDYRPVRVVIQKLFITELKLAYGSSNPLERRNFLMKITSFILLFSVSNSSRVGTVLRASFSSRSSVSV